MDLFVYFVVYGCLATHLYNLMRKFSPDPHEIPHNKKPNIVKTLVVGIAETYLKCNPNFTFKSSIMPIITEPHEGIHNEGTDNVNFDYVFRKGDVVINDKKNQKYEVLYLLGKGTFGQVLCCRKPTGEKVALKVIKNRQNYYRQALFEAKILKTINKHEREEVPESLHRIVTMLDVFVWKKHLSIVFETLERNLYDLLKECNFEGMDLLWIRHWTRQIVQGLCRIHQLGIIHCDLKPENIMFKKEKEQENIRIVDFGSSCFEKEIPYKYIQSRFYRAPEVILGLGYSTKIDMWSLGCVLVELYIGLPLFPGNSSYDMLKKMVGIIGVPERGLLSSATFADKYFRLEAGTSQLKTEKEFEEDSGTSLPPSKNYYKLRNLKELKTIKIIPEEEDPVHDLFFGFCEKLLQFDPQRRLSSLDALSHPFLTPLQQ